MCGQQLTMQEVGETSRAHEDMLGFKNYRSTRLEPIRRDEGAGSSGCACLMRCKRALCCRTSPGPNRREAVYGSKQDHKRLEVR